MIKFEKADNIPRMSETFQDRAKQRLKALGLSPSGASEKAGLSRETLPKLLKNEQAMPGSRTLSRLAEVLQVNEQWLLTGEGNLVVSFPRREGETEEEAIRRWEEEKEKTSLETKHITPMETGYLKAAAAAPSINRSEMPANVPVMGTAAGSLLSGAFQLQGGVIDYVRRPPALSGARDIYALYVEGSSMEPRYFPGELVYVNPHKPPRIGDTVIVQEGNGDASNISASIGVLHKRANGVVILRKYNPPNAEFNIDQTRISAIHRVLTPNELFGV